MDQVVNPCDIFTASPFVCHGGKPGEWNPTLLIEHDNPMYDRPASAGLRINKRPGELISLYGDNDREMLVCEDCFKLPASMFLSESGWKDLKALLATLNCGISPNKIGMQFERITNGIIETRPYLGEGFTFLRGKVYDPQNNVVRDWSPHDG